jgi:hypothetical protein
VNKSNAALALVSCWALAACFGTETDNPVTSNQPGGIDYTSPERFEPPASGCAPPDPEDEPYRPRIGNLSLSSPDGSLFQLVAEPLELSGASVPPVEALELQLRLVQLDPNDPERRTRVAQVPLAGDAWGLRARGAEIWVATARRSAEQRACGAPRYECGWTQYEALVLRGFRPTAGALEPLARVELPFERRAWWGADGIVSVVADTLHVVGWGDDGALGEPMIVPVDAPATTANEGTPLQLGPAELRGNRLLVVRARDGVSELDIYDLAAGGAPRSFALGEPLGTPAAASLFFGGQLWLQDRYGMGPAQVWDVTLAEPARLALPAVYQTVLPVAGATRQDGSTGEILALGWPDPSSGQGATLLSFADGIATAIGAPDPASWAPPASFGGSTAAHPGLVGQDVSADSDGWSLAQPGPGLPLELRPQTRGAARPSVIGSVAVLAPDGAVAQAVLQRSSQTELVFAGSSAPLELSPGTFELFATRTRVVALDTTDLTQCQQTGEDCSLRSPGVRIFEAAAEPRLVASLPLPELPLPPSTPPSQLSISWTSVQDLAGRSVSALRLSDERLAFVATVDMSCDTPEGCEALGIEALPFGEANVAAGATSACPPAELEPDCVSMPAPVPSVYGSSQRQYLYVLELDAQGGPAWRAWGESSLESSTARRDPGGFSRFAAPLVGDGLLATTRLEREDRAGELLPGRTLRFMLDRFALDAQDTPRPLPPVNVPGYPLARLGGGGELERWLTIEAAPGETGHARLLRLEIETRGDAASARIDGEVALDAGSFGGALLVQPQQTPVALALMSPANACGTTQLAAVPVVAAAGDAERLAIADTLELPADDWDFAASDGPYVLLRSYPAYLLVQVAPDGSLTVAGAQSLATVLGEQLIGTTLYTADADRARRVELAP